jgi:hypothetical protein
LTPKRLSCNPKLTTVQGTIDLRSVKGLEERTIGLFGETYTKGTDEEKGELLYRVFIHSLADKLCVRKDDKVHPDRPK